MALCTATSLLSCSSTVARLRILPFDFPNEMIRSASGRLRDLEGANATTRDLSGRLRKAAQKLKAECVVIEELAAHDIDMVAAGMEKVGPDPMFVAQKTSRVCPACGRPHSVEIALYSALLEELWATGRRERSRGVGELKNIGG